MQFLFSYYETEPTYRTLSFISMILIFFTLLFFLLVLAFLLQYRVDQKEGNLKAKNIIIAIIFFTLLFEVFGTGLTVSCITDYCNPRASIHLLYRYAQDSDITLSEPQLVWNESGEEISFTANSEIDHLVLTMYCYDDSGNTVTALKRSFENVSARNQYQFSYSAADFTADELGEIRTYALKVTDGIIHKFQMI